MLLLLFFIGKKQGLGPSSKLLICTCASFGGKGGGAVEPLLRPIFLQLAFVLNIL